MGIALIIFLVYCVGGWVVRAIAASVWGGKESAGRFAMGFYDVLCGAFIYGASQASLNTRYLSEEEEIACGCGVAFGVVICICGALYLYMGYKSRQQEEERNAYADKNGNAEKTKTPNPYAKSGYIPMWKRIEQGEEVHMEYVEETTGKIRYCQYCGVLVSAKDAKFCGCCGKEL